MKSPTHLEFRHWSERKLPPAKFKHFKEIELNTGMGRGFLFKPLKVWIEPTLKWANGNYSSL